MRKYRKICLRCTECPYFCVDYKNRSVLFPLFEKVQVAMAVTDRNMDVSTSHPPAPNSEHFLRFFSLFHFMFSKERHGQRVILPTVSEK